MTDKNLKFVEPLESLRGFAALGVVFYHLFVFTGFNLGFPIREVFFLYSPPGHLMVLVFFMLSGFVIGISNKSDRPFNLAEYGKKRFVRLYPIYVLSILLTIILFKEHINIILGNLVFVQNLIVDNLLKNQSLWSLNHEIIYYLLAIPILYYKPKLYWIGILIAIFLSFSLFINPFPAYVEAYLVGFSFWLSGFALSKLDVTGSIKSNEVISIFFLLLATEILNLFGVLLVRIPVHEGSNQFFQSIIKFKDFSYMPVCLYSLSVFTGTLSEIRKYLFSFVYGSSFMHLFYVIYTGSYFKTEIFIIPSLFLLLSMFLQFIKLNNLNFGFFAWTGSISYALYVIHAPIILYFENFKFWGGSAFTFLLRCLVFLPVVFSLAYLMDKKLQPIVKNYCFRKN